MTPEIVVASPTPASSTDFGEHSKPMILAISLEHASWRVDQPSAVDRLVCCFIVLHRDFGFEKD